MLTRTGIGKNAKLCIMELKDEYEAPNKVLMQALAYTVFVRELLRSNSGNMWWELFGFNRSGNNPLSPQKPLALFSACVMPTSEKLDADKSFAGNALEIEGDVIELHYVYFKENDNKIESIWSSLPHTMPKG